MSFCSDISSKWEIHEQKHERRRIIKKYELELKNKKNSCIMNKI